MHFYEINKNPLIDELLTLFSKCKEESKVLQGFKLNTRLKAIQIFIMKYFVNQGIFFEIQEMIKSWSDKLINIEDQLDDGLYNSFCEDLSIWQKIVQNWFNNFFIFDVDYKLLPNFRLIQLIDHLIEKTKNFFFSPLEYRSHYVDVVLQNEIDPRGEFIRFVGSCLINKNIQAIIESIEISGFHSFRICILTLNNENWEEITPSSLADIIDFIDDLFLLKTNRKYFNIFCKLIKVDGLSAVLQEQLDRLLNEKKNFPRFNHIRWIQDSRFQLSSLSLNKKNPVNFNRFNVFIGKNNTGKTEALRNTLDFLCFHDTIKLFKPEDNFKKQFDLLNKNGIRILEPYYIPKERTLNASSGSVKDFHKNLLILLDTIKKKLCTKKQEWSIEDFSQLLKPFFTYFEWTGTEFRFSEPLSEKEKEIIFKIWRIMIKLKRILFNWKEKIWKYFHIDIMPPKEISATTYCIPSYSVYLQNKDNWREYGSGTKELLSLIFFIEFLKEFPAINFDRLIQAAENNNVSKIEDDFIHYERNNRFILLDEPEISLHPELLRKFFNYLKETSDLIQIFIATHSPFFLDSKEINKYTNIFLFRINDASNFEIIPIQEEKLLMVHDELYNFDAKEAALFFSRNEYQYLLTSTLDLQELKMVKTIINYRIIQENFKTIIELGTSYEDPTSRLIQNTLLLVFSPEVVDLNGDSSNQGRLTKIFLSQLNSFSQTEFEELKSKPNKMRLSKWRFLNLCSMRWGEKKALKKGALSYNDNNSRRIQENIKEHLIKIEDEIEKNSSIIVFPENSLPYDILEDIIKFAMDKEVVIIGGMEHKHIDIVEGKMKVLEEKIPKLYQNKYDYNSFRPKKTKLGWYRKHTFINQSIIINSNGKFCFQIKNSPTLLDNITEPIPLILYPEFRKINTKIGIITVMICKDFLVNNRIINKWMTKNEIPILVIPSFTRFVSPFTNKFGEIVYSREEKLSKLFIFSNIAEYSGSGIYNYKYRYKYEPGSKDLFKLREEGIKKVPL